ncbi:MAG: type II toxin-antitoxin system VapC family toxin [Hyphomonadaceae bacterium]|nr:type II toxin-antitoxin system VapC family toxin [Hyphomonadaceae bacterium]
MKLLLDSHAAYWWLGGIPLLSKRARQAIQEAGPNDVHFSPASVYELELKMSAGKMTRLPSPFLELARSQSFVELPIRSVHADLAARFPPLNKDPWDRVLAAQAISENMSIVTRDARISALGATVLW